MLIGFRVTKILLLLTVVIFAKSEPCFEGFKGIFIKAGIHCKLKGSVSAKSALRPLEMIQPTLELFWSQLRQTDPIRNHNGTQLTLRCRLCRCK